MDRSGVGRSTVRNRGVVAGIWTALVVAGGPALDAQEPLPRADAPIDAIDATIRFDRSEGPVLQNGERLRIYYEVSEDAWVAVLHIDTDGNTRLVHPRSPDEDARVQGGRENRLLFPRSSFWTVDEDPGKGYFFLLASPEPFDLSDVAWEYTRGGWDLEAVGARVYRDPFEAVDEYVARLIPAWETLPYGLAYAEYDVESDHDYPRFVCYDCHGFSSFSEWNPYSTYCPDYRVVIYTSYGYGRQPWYGGYRGYPTVYDPGVPAVFPRPVAAGPRYGFKERADDESGAPTVVPTRERAERRRTIGTTTDTRTAADASRTARRRSAAASRPISSSSLEDLERRPGLRTSGRPGRASNRGSTRPQLDRSTGGGWLESIGRRLGVPTSFAAARGRRNATSGRAMSPSARPGRDDRRITPSRGSSSRSSAARRSGGSSRSSGAVRPTRSSGGW